MPASRSPSEGRLERTRSGARVVLGIIDGGESMQAVITSLGMISAVGHSVRSSVAAIRAGISRPRPLPGARDLDLDEGAARAFVGHPIDGVTNGFAGVGRWKRLGERAGRDLLRGTSGLADRLRGGRAALLVALPVLEPERFLLDDPVPPDALRSDVGGALAKLLDLPFAPEAIEVLCGGHAGALAALERASALIAGGSVDLCLVLALDSYLDGASLDWLAAASRLKADDHPTGLLPGEAGACFLVESPSAARRAKVTPVAEVKAVRTGHSQKPWSDAARNGIELSATIRAALAGAPFSGDLVLDLNGETWRAQELGCALPRVSDVLGSEVRWLTPAESLGDTGAASGAVGLSVAIGALERGWSLTTEALVVSMSEDGAVAAARIGAVRPGKG